MGVIIRSFRDTLETVNKKQNTNLNSLSLCDHHFILKSQIYSLGKLNSKELYNNLILTNN